MQALTSLLGGFLGDGIVSTTGVVWIPVLIMVGLQGCAVYGGVYFALRVASRGNAKSTSLFVVGLICIASFSNGYGLIDQDAKGLGYQLLLLVLYGAAGIIGCLVAYNHIISERSNDLPEEAI